MIVLGCQVLTEVGALEKIGSPQPVDGEGASAPTANGSAQASTSINPYAQQPQQQQQVQQPRPSQYDPSVSPKANDSGNITVYPIEGLSPYQNK